MLKYDLHVHTMASGHAFNTVYEIATAAAEKGIQVIALTDHGPSMERAPHDGYFEMLSRLPRELNGVKLLRGCEANIINLEGDIDLSGEIQKQLDFIIAGIHKKTPYPKNSTIEENTLAIIKAIEKNRIHAISHPWRPEFPVDLVRIAEVANKYNVALEINLSLLNKVDQQPLVLPKIREMIELVKKNGGKLIVSTDAHIISELGENQIIKELKIDVSGTNILGDSGGYKEIMEFLNKK